MSIPEMRLVADFHHNRYKDDAMGNIQRCQLLCLDYGPIVKYKDVDCFITHRMLIVDVLTVTE